MKTINLNREWQFIKEPPAIFYIMQQKGDHKIVNLPHDASIYENVNPDTPEGRNTGYHKGVFANYNKYIDIPQTWEGQRIYLEMDGAFAHTEISVNGHLVKIHPSGYMPVIADLTDYIHYGKKNRINVFTNNVMQYTARWYHGSGIYRSVNLKVGPQIHLSNWPIFAYTKHMTKLDATVLVSITAENHTAYDQKVNVKIKFYQTPEHGESVSGDIEAYGESIIYVPKHDKRESTTYVTIENPRIWNIDNPELYTIVSELYIDNELIDSDSVLFGIRTITLDTKNGLMLNGHPIKLKGGCVHHDQGILGAATFYDSEYRKMKLHKDNGYNAIRSAHNPSSKEMLEACDRLGLIVMAEAFDVWNMPKNANDYHLFFDKHWEEDLELFMMRDRNHPSIFFWSIGNEIVERNHVSNGDHTSYKLAKKARLLDPSRFITAAIPTTFNGLNDDDTMGMLKSLMSVGGPIQNLSTPFAQEIWGDRTEAFCAPLDLVGYNYLDSRYDSDHKLYPNRIICGTESYPDNIDIVWEKVLKHSHVIGDFTWTSHDYIGEVGVGNVIYRNQGSEPVSRAQLQAGNFPHRSANCADFDLLGFDRPQLHYRRIVWGSDETYIAVGKPENYGKIAQTSAWGWEDLEATWTFENALNQPIYFDVYSAAEEVEVLLNNKSLGKRRAGKSNRYRARFETVYEPGVLRAISYNQGIIVSEHQLISASQPKKIKLETNCNHLKADGESLAYVTVHIVDEEDRLVSYVKTDLVAHVEGDATLQAFGSANPITVENYTTGSCTTYQGRLMAVIRSGYSKGVVRLNVESNLFKNACIEIEVI